MIAKRGMKAAKWFPAVDTRLVLFSFLFTCLKHKEREGEEKNKEMKKKERRKVPLVECSDAGLPCLPTRLYCFSDETVFVVISKLVQPLNSVTEMNKISF